MMKGALTRFVLSTTFIAGLQITPAFGQSITIALEGQIPISCGVDALDLQINLGDISVAGARVIPFRVRCNTPFTFKLLSKNGALQTASLDAAAAGFTNRVPYTAAVHIPTNIGAVRGSCSSSRLRQAGPICAYPDSGEGIALSGDAALTISWEGCKEPLAGGYGDMITVVLGARL
jgi:hypothetical protein